MNIAKSSASIKVSIRVKLAGKWGFINKLGEEVIPPRFDYAMDFSKEGYASVGLNGVSGKVYRNGQFVDYKGLEEGKNKSSNREISSKWSGWLTLIFGLFLFFISFANDLGFLIGVTLFLLGCLSLIFAACIFSDLV